ncbi:glutamate-rich protein 6B [Balaenoptera musculus]|uniref:Glutamate-rich protein 6B n=1 Tax=Balaenoptera musculus TaxID=9771 RepID=A0A8B8VSS3_BALMU|nr:glutamate-rich protein 6B [Balaenoptera musculus]
MSARKLQPSGTSPPHPSTTFHHSAQTSSSEEEGTEGDEESSMEEFLFPREEESPEEDQYLEEEENYLKGKTYLYEKEYLKEEKHLQKKELLEGKMFLYEKFLEEGEYLGRNVPIDEVAQICLELPPTLKGEQLPGGAFWLEQAASSSFPQLFAPSLRLRPLCPRSLHQGTLTPTGNSSSLVLGDTTPSTSLVKRDGEFLGLQDQSTQTEWICESRQAEEFASKESFWDRMLSDPIGTLEADDFEANVVTSSYQSVFRTMLKEMAARNELEEDMNIPLTGHLESETRRKLGILLKKNFGKYKETILWIMKKREKTSRLVKRSGRSLHSSCHEPSEPKAPRVEDTGLLPSYGAAGSVQRHCRVHQGDGKIILYPSETVFQILFPDGSGQIYYPSGHLAMLILSIKEGKFTYIILEDSENMCVRALINNSGHATFYDENGNIWLNLSQNLGYYFARDKYQKAWNWWDLNLHIHAPPVQPISLKINQYIKVQIRSQDKIIFRFNHKKKHICLNLGTKYKYITPAMLSKMKKKAVLEMEFSSTARKIQILLGKMSKILNILTISDLECFIQGIKILPTRQYELEEELSSSKLGQSPNCAASARAECLGEVEVSKAPRKLPKP